MLKGRPSKAALVGALTIYQMSISLMTLAQDSLSGHAPLYLLVYIVSVCLYIA